ncbi:MAG: arylsulfatase [Pirellulaceae bacterium]|nr:arylsulfatase [Pirellulaceae bacterium]
MLRRELLVGLLMLVSVAVAAAADKPNVIVIYTDDQGFGDASCLNADSKFQTPNLDRLAREGISMTDAHCSDTVCTPSRYGLLTGRYSWRTHLKSGVFGAEKECLIINGRMTLASLLRDQGYHTAMIGKWHLGMDFPGDRQSRDWSQPVRDMPLDKGFDYFWGIPASMNYGVLAWFDGRYAAVPPTQYTQKKPNKIALSDYRIMPPYESKLEKPGTTNNLGVVKGKLEVAPDFVDAECLTRFTDKAMEWMVEKSEDARNGKPFFVYLPYTSPHKPVIPIEKFRGKSEAGAYGDFMIETDWHVGRILDLLDREKLADNTLVIFTSDNGPETTWKERVKKFGHHSNGIYREGKRSIYEGGHRVPFFARWPAKIKAGSVCDKPICQTDVLATLAEIVDVKMPDHAGEDSVSFYDSLVNPEVSERQLPIIHHSSGGGFAIRQGQWKLVMAHGNRQKMELYDVVADPSEEVNVLADHPQVAKSLTLRISEIVRNGRTTTGVPQKNDTPWWDSLTWMEPW